MENLEKMSAKELRSLKTNIDKELEKRERLEYEKLLENFANAFYELYSKFPGKYCFTDEAQTWEDLYEDNSWNFCH